MFANLAKSFPRLRYLGLGFMYVWIWSSYTGSGVYHGSDALIKNTDALWSVTMLASIGMALVCGFFFSSGHGRKLLSLRHVLLLVCPLGILLFALASYESRSWWTAPVASALMGAGGATICMLWVDALSYLDTDETEMAVAASPLTAVGCALAFPLVPSQVLPYVVLLLPIASCLCLDFCYRDIERAGRLRQGETARGTRRVAGNGQDTQGCAPSKQSAPRNRRTPPPAEKKEGGLSPKDMAFRVAVPLFVGYAASLWTNVTASAFEQPFAWGLPSIIGSLAGLLFVAAFVLYAIRVDLASLFRLVWPLLTVALACCAVPLAAFGLAAHALADVAETAMRIVTYLMFVRMAKADYRAALQCAGAALAATFAGAWAGNSLALATLPLFGSHAEQAIYPILGLICLVALSVVPLLQPRPFACFTAAESAPPAPLRPSTGDGRCLAQVSPPSTPPDRIADAFGLTERERDVLALLAAGRSQPYIRERLSLSKSTVSTHVEHIYQKCGVHSREELLDMVDAFASGARTDTT